MLFPAIYERDGVEEYIRFRRRIEEKDRAYYILWLESFI
jgi:hypothetical protein